MSVPFTDRCHRDATISVYVYQPFLAYRWTMCPIRPLDGVHIPVTGWPGAHVLPGAIGVIIIKIKWVECPGSGVVTSANDPELTLDSSGKIAGTEKEITEKVKEKQKQKVQKIIVIYQPWVLVRWNRIDWDETQYRKWAEWEQSAIKEESDEAQKGLKREQQKLEEADQQVESVMDKIEKLDKEIEALELKGVTVDAGSSGGDAGKKASTGQQQLTPEQEQLLAKKRERASLYEQVYEELEKWAGRKGLVKNAEERLEKAQKAMKEWDNYNRDPNDRKSKRTELITKSEEDVKKARESLEERKNELKGEKESKINDMKKDLEESTKERDDLKAKLASAKNKDKPELEKQIQQAKKVVDLFDEEVKFFEEEKKLKGELDNARKELNELVAKVEKSADAAEKQTLEQEVQKAEQKLEQAVSALKKHDQDRLNKRIEGKKKQLEEEKKQLNELKAKLDKATKDKDKKALGKQIQQVQEKVKFLEVQVKELEATKARDELKNKLESANKELDDLMKKLEKTVDTSEKQQLETKLKQSIESLQKAETDLNELVVQQMNNKKIDEKKKELEWAKKELEELKTKLASAKSKDKPKLQEQVKEAEENVKSLEAEVKLKSELENAIKQNDMAKIQAAEKALEKHEADQMNKKIAANKQELEKATKELDDLKTKLQSATKDKDKKALGEQVNEAEQKVQLLDAEAKLLETSKALEELMPKLEKAVDASEKQTLEQQVQQAEQKLEEAEQEWEKLAEQKKKAELEDQKKKELERAKEVLGDQLYKLEVLKAEIKEIETQVQQAELAVDEKSQTLEDNQFITVWMKKTDYELMEIGRTRAGKSVPVVIAEQVVMVPEQDNDWKYTEKCFGENEEAEGEKLKSLGKAWVEKNEALSQASTHQRLTTLNAQTARQNVEIDWAGSGDGGISALFGGRDTTSVLSRATFMTTWGGNDEFNQVRQTRYDKKLKSGGVVIHGQQGWHRLYSWGGMGLGHVAAGSGVKVQTIKAGTTMVVEDHNKQKRQTEVKKDMTVYDGGSRSVWDTSGSLKLAGVHETTAQQTRKPALTEEQRKERRKQLEEEWKASQQQKNAGKEQSESSGPRLVLTVKTKQPEVLVESSTSAGAAGIRA
ncbi:hypothetical protein MACJ_003932 [Theileria orientalis]|uniref:Uncharacterized protein n=1 Tax=Theileria orientalis TaxID=68886 RepID=A0A976SKQ7_THEOR|nr:hypothetical protein MACJ_003932 [Theileria orientalis]